MEGSVKSITNKIFLISVVGAEVICVETNVAISDSNCNASIYMKSKSREQQEPDSPRNAPNVHSLCKENDVTLTAGKTYRSASWDNSAVRVS